MFCGKVRIECATQTFQSQRRNKPVPLIVVNDMREEGGGERAWGSSGPFARFPKNGREVGKSADECCLTFLLASLPLLLCPAMARLLASSVKHRDSGNAGAWHWANAV